MRTATLHFDLPYLHHRASGTLLERCWPETAQSLGWLSLGLQQLLCLPEKRSWQLFLLWFEQLLLSWPMFAHFELFSLLHSRLSPLFPRWGR